MKNSFIKVLSFVMALTMIVGCFTAISFSAAECTTHTKGDVVKTVPATCIDTGYTVYKCSTCSKEFVADVTPATETHTPVDVTGSAATCDSPALAAGKKCSVCGTVISGCGPVAGSAPLMHDWKETKTPATCGAKEALVHTCVRCGKTADQLKAAYDALSAADKAKFPAAVLADINANLKEEFGNALAHDWDYAVKTAPTTCVDGVTVATCANCKASVEYAIKATHNYVAIENVSRPCVDGKVKDGAPAGSVPKACSYCGAFNENTEAKSEVKHVYTAQYAVGTTLTADMMNSTFQAFGLKVGDSLNTAAKCNAAGSYFGKCACGAYSIVSDPATGSHTYTAWTWKVGSATVAADALDTAIAGKFCTDAIVRSRKCSVCDGAAESVTVVAAGSHNLEVEVVAPTCTAEGYTVSDCKVCSYIKKDAYVAKLGHSYGDAVVTGDCESGIVSTKTCTVSGCGHEATTTIKAAGSHNYVEGAANVVKVAPTCTAEGYYGYKCADCDSIKRESELGVWGAKDPNNHTSLEFVDDEKPYVYGKEASCTATGKFFKKCTACGTDTNVVTVEVDAPKLAHVWGTSYSKNNSVVKNYAAKAPDCQKTGLTEGYCCKNCGADDTTRKQTVVEKNPNNHVGGMTLISSHDATCVAAGYDKYLTACCGYVTVPNADKPATGNHVYETVDAKAPSCTEAGNHEYKKCDCGLVNLNSIVFPADCDCGLNHTDLDLANDYVIPALGGHDFEISDANKATHVIAEQPETCTDNGKKAYTICENNCGAYLIDGQVVVNTVAASNDNGVDERQVALLILPHGDKYRATVANKAATCTATGIEVTNTMKDANGKVCTKCYNKAQADGGYVVNALGHDYDSEVVNAVGSAKYNCTEATYTLHVCDRCDISYADAYTAGVAAHNWSAVEDTNKTAGDFKCIDGVRKAYKCVACTEYNYVQISAPVAHKYSTGVAGADVAIDLSCTAISAFDGKECIICRKTVDASEDPAAGTLTASHKISTATQELTCTQDGFSIVYCSACNEEFSAEYVKAPGHRVYRTEAEAKADTANVYSVVKCTPATDVADGSITYVCNICKEEVTLVIPATQGLTLKVKANGAAVANNQVELKVSLSATNYAFNEIKFQIAIDPAQVALADVAVKVDYPFAATDAVTAVASDNGNYIQVLVYAPNGADGKAKNVTVTGTDAAFVTITLDVLATANGAAAITGATASNVAYIADNGAVAYKDPAVISATAFNTTVIGNVNGDNKLDAGDSIVIQSAIYAGTYIAEADFDKNGKIDLADHVAFIKFVTSRQTVLDYLAVMGITVEDIVADMKLAYDLDFDRAVGTDNDKAVLVAAVTETLANCAYTTFATTYRCSIDEFVAKTAHDIVVPPSVQ